MGAAAVIFCERTGDWTAAWRRTWDCSAPLVETRSVRQCLDALRQAPASLVAIELTAANYLAALDLLAEMAMEFRLAATAVLADRSVPRKLERAEDRVALEWLARELGAVHFVSAPRRLAALCDVARRHLERAPVEPVPLRQQIWSRLPWDRWSTGRWSTEGI